MNKRIKTTWEETTKTCTPREGDYVSVSSKNIQDFTEQIVKECAMIADKGFGSAHFGLGISGKMLKDHFGIKE